MGRSLILRLGVLLALAPAHAQAQVQVQGGVGAEGQSTVPPLAALVAAPASELRDVVERYAADRAVLLRRYDAPYSPERQRRMREFYQAWQARLRELDFDRLGVEGRIDYILLEHELRYQLALLDREERVFAETESLLPFARTILSLHDARRRHETIDPRAAADTLAGLLRAIDGAREAAAAVQRGTTSGTRTVASSDGAAKAADEERLRGYRSRVVAYRAAVIVDSLRQVLRRWNGFHAGYDPLFTWWTADPYRRVDSALVAYGRYIRRELAGIREGEPDPIIGDPIGAAGMAADLAHEMIAYSPQELIAIAERELAWCEAEMRKAAREMGFGDDWKAALEKVKTLHVAPGQQPAMVRDLAYEAVAFVEERDLVTIPPLAKEVWRMEMMSPERQRVAPFFLGGEVILVSFPTDGMTHEEKLMSMRGNNIHFSRATVHHELIPGHHLQGFMTSRYNTHRRVFATPFWTEGWALYWELLLWDLGFPSTPEDRIGMLFWRAHRAARIMFSLGVHLGTMTPEEAIELLVERVGHERANAEAEVRRSFIGTYPPLYQAAYMIGGLQIRALYKELVETGRMTARAFHDAILQGGRMPIEMVRARLMGELLPRDYTARWRFAGDP
ncbi:MAG: DUF885 family protein [bacterium]